MMYSAVFFDWDGTLVDSLGLLFAAHNHTRAYMGHPQWTREEYNTAMSSSTRELYPKLYGARAQEAQDYLYTYIHAHHLDHLTLMDGVQDLLDGLHAKHIPMAVISNKRNDVLVKEVEHLGWQKYFGAYLGAGIAAKDKPAADPILYAADTHSQRPDVRQILYVGDTETDLKASQAAGCACAFVLHGKANDALLNAYAPAIVADDLIMLKQRLIHL